MFSSRAISSRSTATMAHRPPLALCVWAPKASSLRPKARLAICELSAVLTTTGAVSFNQWRARLWHPAMLGTSRTHSTPNWPSERRRRWAFFQRFKMVGTRTSSVNSTATTRRSNYRLALKESSTRRSPIPMTTSWLSTKSKSPRRSST